MPACHRHALQPAFPAVSPWHAARRQPFAAVGGLVVAVLLGSLSSTRAAAPVQYNRDIRPILSEHCFQCHGPDVEHREAELRLDAADSATQDRGGYAAIVPGDPASSEVVARIQSLDPDLQMPPGGAHKRLSPPQLELLTRWIEQGAPYQSHWSFVPPERPPLPQVTPGWTRNEIDHFILARLNELGEQPAAEAERAVLARRVTLDLTGLSPSEAEVRQFLADQRPDAYEHLVDRLLANERFGERMALDWLDAARYADTNGFSIDGGRQQWLWRDWVINAFNRNLPYDRFLVEQLAGDLLPNPTEAQMIATGFQRNNMVTHEGGTIPAENLVNYNADRVKTLGEAILGLTLGCAQCHDHKYDPISQREYYQLFAYFNTLGDQGLDGNAGINPQPYQALRTILAPDDLKSLRAQIARLEHTLANPTADDLQLWISDQRHELQQRQLGLQLHRVRPIGVSTPNSGRGFRIDSQRYVQIARTGGVAAYDVVTRLPALDEPIAGLRIVFHPGNKTPQHGWGWGHLKDDRRDPSDADPGKGTFLLTAFSASVDKVPINQVNIHRLLKIKQVTASSWAADHRPEQVLDMRRENGWSPQHDSQGPVHLTVTFEEPIDPSTTPHLTVQFNFGQGDHLVAAKFEILAFTGRDDDSPLPEHIIELVEMAPKDWSPHQRQQLQQYYRAHAPQAEPLRIELANLRERLASLTEPAPTMVMREASQPRETFVLHRGSYQQPGEKVVPGTPAALPPLPPDAPANRLGLAQWLTMRGHPLTARVAVNRLWSQVMGRGLVASLADLGAQGEYPSHPELLDWLAVQFIESGWDVKALLRQLVLSATYRQSSVPTASLLAQDPANRWLARGPRFRLPAESIRDSALRMGGLLVEDVGGPSVNPYAPGDLWREVSHYGSTPATAQTFVQDHGTKLYRRSLYTYWKRTSPPPNLTVFDAPTRETCTISRAQTITPLQAMVLLNDVQFVEASRGFAQRVIGHSTEPEERLRWAFWEALSRPPAPEEARELLRLLEQQLARYRSDLSAATALIGVGESLSDPDVAPDELAAWTQVTSVLMNLSETITRN
jgi:hypothetical protein